MYWHPSEGESTGIGMTVVYFQNWELSFTIFPKYGKIVHI